MGQRGRRQSLCAPPSTIDQARIRDSSYFEMRRLTSIRDPSASFICMYALLLLNLQVNF